MSKLSKIKAKPLLNFSSKILYEKKIIVKFGETDPQGIMYFNHPLQIAHECLEEYWSQTATGWDYWFRNPQFAAPIRHCDCDFLKPLVAGQKYTARLSVAEIKNSSVIFNCEFIQNQVLHAKTTTTHVFVDAKTFKKISIPKKIKKKLQSLA